jgi:hypothetical protein
MSLISPPFFQAYPIASFCSTLYYVGWNGMGLLQKVPFVPPPSPIPSLPLTTHVLSPHPPYLNLPCLQRQTAFRLYLPSSICSSPPIYTLGALLHYLHLLRDSHFTGTPFFVGQCDSAHASNHIFHVTQSYPVHKFHRCTAFLNLWEQNVYIGVHKTRFMP